MLPYQVTALPLYVVFVKIFHWVPGLKPLIVPSFFGDAFSIFLLRQFFRSVPDDLADAARVDGASDWQIMTRVIVPLAKPAIAAVALFNFLYAWNDFFAPLLYVGEDSKSWTLAIGLSEFKALHHVAVEPDDGGVARVHDPGRDPVLPDAEGVHRGHHGHRRQGVVSGAMKVALFGCGWIQDFHARAVVACGHEVTVVANHREETARAFAERHGIERVTTDWEAVAADPSIDAVVIGTPNALHAPQAVAALSAGMHVLVEKPMATSVAECDAMIAAAAGSGARLMVAHCWRFHPDVRALRDRIAGGRAGRGREDPRVRRARGLGTVGLVRRPRARRRGRAARHGGARDRHGAVPARRPGARRGSARRSAPATATTTVDDDGILLISWSQGTNSIVESGWWQPHKEGLEAETEVYGTGGYARIFPREEPSEDYEHCTQPMYTTQMREFLGAIEEGRQPRPSGQDGRAVMEIVEARVRVGGGDRVTLVLGVDGGGRKTYAVVADEHGEVLGAGQAGASNWEIAGADGARAAIASAVGAAVGEASSDGIAAAVFGLAGLDWPSDEPRLTELVADVTPGAPRRLVNDAFIALRAGTSESWGIAVIAGTGTVAVGRDPVGNEFRTIGEGRVFGDFGDEFDVSELAVRAVADHYTGRGPATMLSDMLCERLGQPTVASRCSSSSRDTTHGCARPSSRT